MKRSVIRAAPIKSRAIARCTCVSRPNIRPAYLAIHNAFNERRDQIFQRLIDESLLNGDLNARQWAIFFEGQMLSRALNGVIAEWGVHSDWEIVARHCVASTP